MGAFPGLTPVDGAGLRARLRLTGVLAGYLLAGVPALALFGFTTLSLVLTPVGLGLLALGVLVPAVSGLAAAHRRVTGRLTGVLPTPRYLEPGEGALGRHSAWVRDPARWRDYAFLAFGGTGGAVLCLVPLAACGGAITWVVLPVVLQGRWWWGLVLVCPLLLLWWILTPILLQARLDAERQVLGVGAEPPELGELRRRVERVSAARTESVDHSAAELRRIERDLHDGAQARIVSLGMNLGLAGELLHRDPDAAAALLAEARATTLSALADLRSVVQGMHPPVLADRGLVGAVQALALDLAVPVTVAAELPGRAPAPVESALYFAVSECLANVVKHAAADRAWVVLRHEHDLLTVSVGDDGCGGATLDGGAQATGLTGIARRLAIFDGRTEVTSPPGGPTVVRMEVPCALSSPRTSPSSGTG